MKTVFGVAVSRVFSQSFLFNHVPDNKRPADSVDKPGTFFTIVEKIIWRVKSAHENILSTNRFVSRSIGIYIYIYCVVIFVLRYTLWAQFEWLVLKYIARWISRTAEVIIQYTKSLVFQYDSRAGIKQYESCVAYRRGCRRCRVTRVCT